MPTTLRVLAFAGSTRQASFNKTLVGAVAETVKEAGADVTMADLADYRLPVFDADLEAQSGKPAEALALLEQTGFVHMRGAHDFTDQALRDDDRSFVVFGMKA